MLALSVAFLSISHQIKIHQSLKRSQAISFLESLKIELSNIENWAGNYPTKTTEFWWNNSDVQNWKMPFAKVVYPFGHDLIKSGIQTGIEKGLSEQIVKELMVLDQAIMSFECILDLLRRLAYANPTNSWNLTRKIAKSTNGIVNLTSDETALLMQNFDLNRFLHVECIGNDDFSETWTTKSNNSKVSAVLKTIPPKTNIYCAYRRVKVMVEGELEGMKELRPSKLFTFVEIVAVVFGISGILLIFASFFYLDSITWLFEATISDRV